MRLEHTAFGDAINQHSPSCFVQRLHLPRKQASRSSAANACVYTPYTAVPDVCYEGRWSLTGPACTSLWPGAVHVCRLHAPCNAQQSERPGLPDLRTWNTAKSWRAMNGNGSLLSLADPVYPPDGRISAISPTVPGKQMYTRLRCCHAVMLDMSLYSAR